MDGKLTANIQINKENILIVGLLILGSYVVVFVAEIYCIFSRRRRRNDK